MIRLKHDFTLVLSRTDSIGDTILTLPMAGMLKKTFPGCRIVFLGRSYTRDVVAVCRHINAFLDYERPKQSAAYGDARFVAGKHEYFPIPQRQIDLSSSGGVASLTQTPGF